MSAQENKEKKSILRQLLLLKAKFASTSAVATIVDWALFTLLADVYLSKVNANLISRSVGSIINFLMQKRFVFEMKRNVWMTFLLTLVVSLGGLALGTVIMYFIGDWEIWASNKYFKLFPKAIETGLVFFYNFYFKRFVFEKRFI